MSILLDALKKSETQRTLGQTPGIHTAVDAPTADETTGPQWIPLSMLALSAVAIAWFGWQQYLEPPMLPASSSEASSPGLSSLDLSSPAAPGLASEESRNRAAAGEDSIQERTPVEAYQADGESAEVVKIVPAPGAREAEARKQGLNQSFTNYDAQDKPDPVEEKQPRPPSITKNRPASAPPAVQSGTDTNAQATAKTQARRSRVEPVTPEPISFWQVPQALRDGLPEIRITVLVYAEASEDRFVLINGQRLVEKDELAPGVVLDEIRRDGAVFSYRKYRFLVKG
jgi:general secretion pathway protein B